jgi:hypothetical protein
MPIWESKFEHRSWRHEGYGLRNCKFSEGFKGGCLGGKCVRRGEGVF